MDNKRFSGKLGEEYDSIKLVWPYYNKLKLIMGKFIKEFFTKSNLKKIHILEIGCGTGDATKIILESDNRIRITAVDNEPILLNKAKENLRAYIEKNRLKLINEDALDYIKKCKSESFDVFASSFVLHNLNKKYRHKILLEIFRILKKEGLFITTDKYVLDDEVEDNKLFDVQMKKFDVFDSMGKSKLKKELLEHEAKDRSPDFLMKEKESIDEMKNIGFKNVNILHREKREGVIAARKFSTFK